MPIQHYYHRVPGSRSTHAAPICGSGTDVTSLTPMTIPMQYLSSLGAPFISPMYYANWAVRKLVGEALLPMLEVVTQFDVAGAG